MKQIRKHITFANVMSSIAVFLVLGGGAAYAAKKIGSNEIKGNSITTGKLKKNAVTASKIKSNSITTAKIKNGAVTGPKVNASTLGTVPNATHATNADNATNWSRYNTTGVVKSSGGTVQLLNVGPFSIVGHCDDVGSGEFESWITLTTNQAHSSMSAYETAYYEANFEPGEEAELGYSTQDSTPYSSEDYYPFYYNGWEATSADGKTLISGLAFNAVHYFGSPCAFWLNSTNAG